MSQADFPPPPYELPHPDDIPPSSWDAEHLSPLLPTWLNGVTERPTTKRDADAMPTIMIVDDEQYIGYLLSMLLMEYNFQTRVVQNAEDAFVAACEEQPALMLIDFMMPNGNGDTLICRLQAHDATRHIPLALMSSARPRLAHLQGIPFLPKPFDHDELVEFVRRHASVPSDK